MHENVHQIWFMFDFPPLTKQRGSKVWPELEFPLQIVIKLIDSQLRIITLIICQLSIRFPLFVCDIFMISFHQQQNKDNNNIC